MKQERKFTKEEIEEKCKNWNSIYLETSAKDKLNVIESFEALIRILRSKSQITDELWKILESEKSINSKKFKKNSKEKCSLM